MGFKIATAVLLISLASLTFVQPSECHEGHCHGEKICGGGWKDYRETIAHTGPKAGADDEAAACKQTLAELSETISTQAAERCAVRHPCAKCPASCNGCEQQKPTGRLGNKARRSKKARQAEDGAWRCEMTAEVVFRCRCSACVVAKPSD
jgi:hypothetical protein